MENAAAHIGKLDVNVLADFCTDDEGAGSLYRMVTFAKIVLTPDRRNGGRES
jgi:hypothetical protein